MKFISCLLLSVLVFALFAMWTQATPAGKPIIVKKCSVPEDCHSECALSGNRAFECLENECLCLPF